MGANTSFVGLDPEREIRTTALSQIFKERGDRETASVGNSLSVHPMGLRSRLFPLNRTEILIGRGVSSSTSRSISLSDPYVSRLHAKLELREGDAYWIVDLGSENGTRVDGIRVSECRLHLGAEIRVGMSRLVILSSPKESSSVEFSFHGFKTTSADLAEGFEKLKKFAASPLPILILGETGSGKELVAKGVHLSSLVSAGPFISVNCAAISPQLLESELFGHKKGSFTGADRDRVGSFKAAQGGTLFLDEVGEIPLSLQAKLLRALESGEIKPVGSDREEKVRVRLLGATHQNLKRRVEEGLFREDLYYRLNVLDFKIPPLRERKGDIECLAIQFAHAVGKRLSSDLIQKLKNFYWEGNVRQLKNVIHKMAYSSQETILGNHSFSEASINELELGLGDSLEESAGVLEEMEKRVIQSTLDRCRGNKRAAAKELGIAKSTLFQKIKKYQLPRSALK